MIIRIIESITYRISRFMFRFTKPRMLGKRRNFQGKVIQNTAIGNTTFIDMPKNLIINDNTYIGHHNFIEASNGINIGEGCQITDFVSLTTHSSHLSIRLYGSQFSKHTDHIGYIKGKIDIGNYTFIGPHTVIMPNTTIGKGCIISAYSYVTGNFPDFSIISGNPAKVVGDTRKLDKRYLDRNPFLVEFYNDWCNL